MHYSSHAAFWFSSFNSIKQPLRRILGRVTQHSFEEQERWGSIISFAEVIGRKIRQDENQLDIFGGFSHREIMQGNKGLSNKAKIPRER